MSVTTSSVEVIGQCVTTMAEEYEHTKLAAAVGQLRALGTVVNAIKGLFESAILGWIASS